MSRLQELMRELCPDGVEYKALGDVCNIRTGLKPKSIAETGLFAYINAGTSNSGYVAESNTIGDTVTTPSRGQGGIGFIGYQSDDFWCGPLCYRVRARNGNLLNRFVYHAMWFCRPQILSFVNEGGTPALNRRDLQTLRIPVPPIEVQREVVRILDEYTAAHDELVRQLEQEMRLREQQLSIARNELLTFSERERVRWMALADVATFGGGHTPSKAVAANYEDDGIWWVTSKDVKTDVLTSTGITISELGASTLTLYPRGTLVMVTRSGVLKRLLPVAFLDDDMTVNQDIKAIMPDESKVLSRYLFHVLKKDDTIIREQYGKVGGTVDSVNFNMVKKHKVPVPPIEVQQRAVEQLDAYVTAHNELAGALTEDLVHCDQRLTLVRNQLLSFPEKVA